MQRNQCLEKIWHFITRHKLGKEEKISKIIIEDFNQETRQRYKQSAVKKVKK